MFNLIVAVISIALIAAMAAASIFYGGEAFSESTARATANTLINQAQQIDGAQSLYRIKNSGTYWGGSIGQFVDDGYLQAVPYSPGMIGEWIIDRVTVESLSNPNSVSPDFEQLLAAAYLTTEGGEAICDEVVAQGGMKFYVSAEGGYLNADGSEAANLMDDWFTGDAKTACQVYLGEPVVVFTYKL